MDDDKGVKLKELLTQSGVLRKEELNEAVQIARETGQMIGKVLIMSGYLSKEALTAALEAQALVRDNQVNFEQAAAAIKAVHDENCTLEEGLARIGWVAPQQEVKTARLGELLLEAGVINQAQFDKALSLSHESSEPLGSCLRILKFIAPEALLHALDLQAAIREGDISRSEGVRQIAETLPVSNTPV
ncbi:MAG TPA: hypothetical protein V6C72_19515 [Chroococcales cyanobacterium]